MVPSDEARNTLEYKDFYIIRPQVHRWDYDEDTSYEGETGRPVPEDFEYASDNNPDWIDIDGLKKVIE